MTIITFIIGALAAFILTFSGITWNGSVSLEEAQVTLDNMKEKIVELQADRDELITGVEDLVEYKDELEADWAGLSTNFQNAQNEIIRLETAINNANVAAEEVATKVTEMEAFLLTVETGLDDVNLD